MGQRRYTAGKVLRAMSSYQIYHVSATKRLHNFNYTDGYLNVHRALQSLILNRTNYKWSIYIVCMVATHISGKNERVSDH